MTFRSALVPYYLSKGFVVFESEEGDIDNIPMSVKIQIHADNLHQENSLLTCKAEILSIINTLKIIIIARYVYDTYASNFYEYCHIEFYNLEFKKNVK